MLSKEYTSGSIKFYQFYKIGCLMPLMSKARQDGYPELVKNYGVWEPVREHFFSWDLICIIQSFVGSVNHDDFGRDVPRKHVLMIPFWMSVSTQ